MGTPSDYIHWIKVDTNDGPMFLANVYLPNPNSAQDITDAQKIIQKLRTDISSLPDDANYALVGDWNADPFTKDSANISLLEDLIQEPLNLTVVQRPDSTCFTRPRSKAHIDNFRVSQSAQTRICSPLAYFPENNIGRIAGNRNKPSDHIPITLSFSLSKKTYQKQKTIRYDTGKLRQGDIEEYQMMLAHLSERWLEWRISILDFLQTQSEEVSEGMLDLFWEGLQYVIASAALQTLGVKVSYKSNKPNYMDPTPAPHSDARQAWKYFENRLRSRQAQKTHPKSVSELEQDIHEKFRATPCSDSKRINKHVKEAMRALSLGIPFQIINTLLGKGSN
jgi:hypothetical protein